MNMIKRLFCDHIWEINNTKILHQKIRTTTEYWGYLPYYFYYKDISYANYQTCLKCGKERIIHRIEHIKLSEEEMKQEKKEAKDRWNEA